MDTAWHEHNTWSCSLLQGGMPLHKCTFQNCLYKHLISHKLSNCKNSQGDFVAATVRRKCFEWQWSCEHPDP
eukprot:186862-Amphidinium_carterae.2